MTVNERKRAEQSYDPTKAKKDQAKKDKVQPVVAGKAKLEKNTRKV